MSLDPTLHYTWMIHAQVAYFYILGIDQGPRKLTYNQYSTNVQFMFNYTQGCKLKNLIRNNCHLQINTDIINCITTLCYTQVIRNYQNELQGNDKHGL